GRLPSLPISGSRQVNGIRMSGSSELQRTRPAIEPTVNHGNEGQVGESLTHQFAVEPGQHHLRRHESIARGGNLLRLNRLFQKDRQQTGRYAVTHRVGNVKADVMLVEAHDVVKVAADLPARVITDAEPRGADGRQRAGEKARLKPAGHRQVEFDLLIGDLQLLTGMLSRGNSIAPSLARSLPA